MHARARVSFHVCVCVQIVKQKGFFIVFLDSNQCFFYFINITYIYKHIVYITKLLIITYGKDQSYQTIRKTQVNRTVQYDWSGRPRQSKSINWLRRGGRSPEINTRKTTGSLNAGE